MSARIIPFKLRRTPQFQQARLFFMRPLHLQHERMQQMYKARISLETIAAVCRRSIAEVKAIVEVRQ